MLWPLAQPEPFDKRENGTIYDVRFEYQCAQEDACGGDPRGVIF